MAGPRSGELTRERPSYLPVKGMIAVGFLFPSECGVLQLLELVLIGRSESFVIVVRDGS